MDCKKPEQEDKQAEALDSGKPMVQMRPDDSDESVTTPPNDEEVQKSVETMNPDENSMNSRG